MSEGQGTKQKLSGAKRFYEFDGLRFYPDERLLVRLDDGHPFGLTPKTSALLLTLIERRGEVVAYGEIKRAVWGETEQVLNHTVRETKRALGQILGDRSHRLETVTGRGYRLNVEAVECGVADNVSGGVKSSYSTAADTGEAGGGAGVSRDLAASQPGPTVQLAPPFGGHLWHALLSCALYSLLYAIALLVEVAYEFDRLGSSALRIAPLVFVWVYATSLTGLAVAWWMARRGKAKGLPLSVLIFAASAFALYFALGFFLPHQSVTESNFQTYTAHGAYLKSAGYFFFAAVIFLIIPFHFVVSMRRDLEAGRSEFVLDLLAGRPGGVPPVGAVYLKPWWLGLLLVVAAVLSPFTVSYLFENLKPHPRTGLFMQLVEWRVIVYLALALECLLWYQRRLSEVRRRRAEEETAGR